MTLGKRQELFMRLLPRLIDKAHEMGYEIRGGDLFRDPRLHGRVGRPTVLEFLRSLITGLNFTKAKEAGYRSYGKRDSQHKKKCAIDLNLFKDGEWLRYTEDHRELGEWWEQQHPYCRWGGRYQDGNHYEVVPWRSEIT